MHTHKHTHTYQYIYIYILHFDARAPTDSVFIVTRVILPIYRRARYKAFFLFPANVRSIVATGFFLYSQFIAGHHLPG